jgi:hypothetical protein
VHKYAIFCVIASAAGRISGESAPFGSLVLQPIGLGNLPGRTAAGVAVVPAATGEGKDGAKAGAAQGSGILRAFAAGVRYFLVDALPAQ